MAGVNDTRGGPVVYDPDYLNIRRLPRLAKYGPGLSKPILQRQRQLLEDQ